MAKVTYDKQLTALLVIDPYNDFISEGGKIWDRLKGCCRSERVCSSYAAGPECCAEGGASRLLCAASSISSGRLRDLEVHCAGSEGSVGATRASNTARGVARSGASSSLNRAISWPSSIGVPVALPTPIWICSSRSTASISSSSSGLIAHTCVEATVRYAAELGYEVTMVKDATAELLG